MENVKTAQIPIFLGVMIAGVIHGRVPLRAQPASDPAPAHEESAPASPTGDAPAQTDGTPTSADDPNKPWNRGVSAERRQAARALFLEGNRLFRIPLFAKAVEKYAAALGQWKHPAFYFNLALAQLNLGQEVEAHESLQRALAHGEEPLGAAQFREAQKQLQDVKRQIGQLRVTCDTPGAEVTLDGVTLFIGPGSYEGWVKAKAHELTAKRAGYLSEARRLTVAAGKLQQIELKLITLSQATDASRRWAAWKPWAVVSAGAVIAAGGGGLHALAARNFDAYDKGVSGLPCSTPSGMPPRVGCTRSDIGSDLEGQLQRARQQQVIAVSSYMVGGALAATGIVLLYMNRPQTAEQSPPGLAARSVDVTPIVSSDMLGLLVSMSR